MFPDAIPRTVPVDEFFLVKTVCRFGRAFGRASGGSGLGVNECHGPDDVRLHLVPGPDLVAFSQRRDDLLMIVIAARHR